MAAAIGGALAIAACGSSGGINLDGTNVNRASPAFVAARERCRKTLPGGSSPPPNPNSGGYSIIEGEPGVFLAVPSSIDANSPAFKHAARACNFQ